MNNNSGKTLYGYILMGLTLAAVFFLGVLGSSIIERREEARVQPPLKEIGEFEASPERWGQNFPYEYSRYLMMKQTDSQTRYGGSFPRDYLEETPAYCILFAGYSFSKEYLQARTHWYALEDVKKTKRITDSSPATCLTCKSANISKFMADPGPEDFYKSSFNTMKDRMEETIACLDCHQPGTMMLRISRPALREAFERRGDDIETVSHQQMRSLVCAQCHVEYYFRGSGSYLTFPWDDGMSIETIDSYYQKTDFSDFVHAVSRTKIVKLQHPDFEIYNTGIHAYRNVACADCHMPYRSEGGMKFTDHFLRSPLSNISNSCAVCHRWEESEIRSRVEAIQDKVREARTQAERNLVLAHFDVAACLETGASDSELVTARDFIRRAQLRWDFIASSNSMGFHSPGESLRILGTASSLAQEARVECARILAIRGYVKPVNYPDFSTKEKAQFLMKAWETGSPQSLLTQTPV